MSGASAPTLPERIGEGIEYTVGSMKETSFHSQAAESKRKAQDSPDDLMKFPTRRRMPTKQFSNPSSSLAMSAVLREDSPSSTTVAASLPVHDDGILRCGTSFFLPVVGSYVKVSESKDQVGQSIPVAADLIDVFDDYAHDPSEKSWSNNAPPGEYDIDSDDDEATLPRFLGD